MLRMTGATSVIVPPLLYSSVIEGQDESKQTVARQPSEGAWARSTGFASVGGGIASDVCGALDPGGLPPFPTLRHASDSPCSGSAG